MNTQQPQQNTTPFDAMEDPYPTYLTYDSRRLVPKKLEVKQIKAKAEDPNAQQAQAQQPQPQQQQGQQGQQAPATSYKEIGLQYNTGSSTAPKLGQFLVEGPVVQTRGIVTKPGLSGRLESSILIALDPTKPELVGLRGALNDIYNDLATIYYNNRFQAGNPQCVMAGIPGIIRHFVSESFDKETGMPLDRPPAIFLKLYELPWSKTQFLTPDGEVIPWSDLVNVDMDIIPLIRFRRIYIGSKPSFQFDLYSAIVTSISPRTTTNIQINSCQRFDASTADAVRQSLLQMQIARQSQNATTPAQQLTAPPVQQDNQENQEQQATFAGLAPAPTFSLESLTSTATQDDPQEQQSSPPIVPRPVGAIRLPVIPSSGRPINVPQLR